MSYEPEYLAACLYVLNVESYLYRKAHTVFSNWRNAIHVICTESEKNNIFCNIPELADFAVIDGYVVMYDSEGNFFRNAEDFYKKYYHYQLLIDQCQKEIDEIENLDPEIYKESYIEKRQAELPERQKTYAKITNLYEECIALYEKSNYVYCNGIPELDSRLCELYHLKNDALEAIIFDYNLQPVDTKIFNNDIELKLYSFYGFSFYLGQDTVVYETEPEVALEDPETASLTIKTGIKQRVLQVQDELDFILHGVEITIPFETALNVIKTYLHRDAEIIRACDRPTK